MKNKQGVLLSLLGVSVLSLLAACSGEDKQESTTDQPSVRATITKDPVELTVFYPYGDSSAEAFMNVYGNDIQKKYPNISIKWLNKNNSLLENLAVSGIKVDIFFAATQLAGQLYDQGYTADLTEQAKKFNFDLTRMEPVGLDMIRKASAGKLTGLPITYNYHVLYYNKSIFDRLGEPYLKDGMTWDELLPIARRLTRHDGGTQYAGFGHRFFSTNWIANQYGQELINPATNQVTFESGKWKDMFAKFLPFFQIQGNPYQTSAIWQTMFYKDKTLATSAELAGYATSSTVFPADLNWDVVQLPSFPDMPGVGSGVEPFNVFLSTTSAHKDEAFAAMEVLVSEEFQLKQAKAAKYPTLKFDNLTTVFGTEQPLMKGKNMNGLLPKKFATPLTLSQDVIAIRLPIGQAFDAAMKGEKDINTTLRDATELANKTLAERKATAGK